MRETVKEQVRGGDGVRTGCGSRGRASVHARRLKPRGSLKREKEKRATRIKLQGYEGAASHGGDDGTSVLTHWHVLGRAGTGCACMLGLDAVHWFDFGRIALADTVIFVLTVTWSLGSKN